MASSSLDCDDWQPTCSLEMLKFRAAALAAARSFFAQLGYMEVETPLMSHDIVVDAHLEPFEIPSSDERLFLQTSPEAGMKRLLAAGSGSIFQVTRSFRRHESGSKHNPEFTMLEWYGVGTTWQDQVLLTEKLVRCIQAAIKTAGAAAMEFAEPHFNRIAYDKAFLRTLNQSVLELPVKQLRCLTASHTSFADSDCQALDRDELLNILLAECVEPVLGTEHPEFLYDYPASQAALAQLNPGDHRSDHRTACRFELYCNGLELCNGYQELTDPAELKARDQQQNTTRTRQSADALPGATRMLAAMNHGLPACSGVALGFDRLLMCLLQETEIRRVIPFPIDRA